MRNLAKIIKLATEYDLSNYEYAFAFSIDDVCLIKIHKHYNNEKNIVYDITIHIVNKEAEGDFIFKMANNGYVFSRCESEECKWIHSMPTEQIIELLDKCLELLNPDQLAIE